MSVRCCSLISWLDLVHQHVPMCSTACFAGVAPGHVYPLPGPLRLWPWGSVVSLAPCRPVSSPFPLCSTYPVAFLGVMYCQRCDSHCSFLRSTAQQGCECMRVRWCQDPGSSSSSGLCACKLFAPGACFPACTSAVYLCGEGGCTCSTLALSRRVLVQWWLPCMHIRL